MKYVFGAIVFWLSLSTAVADMNRDTTESFSMNSELFGTIYNLDEESPFNPGNLLLQLPKREYEVQIRPTVGFQHNYINLTVNPRISYIAKNLEDEAAENERISEQYIQDYSLGYFTGEWSISYGRELIFWGPSQFSSPSNPFYSSNNETNPFVEAGAGDFLQTKLFLSKDATLSAIVNTRQGRSENYYPEYKKVGALKFDYIENNYSTSAIMATRDQRPLVGMFGQWTVSDAMLLYIDMGIKDKSEGLYPSKSVSDVGWKFEASDVKNNYMDAVLGVSYTFLSGSTFNVEYRHNDEGYDKTQTENYYLLADYAASTLYEGNISRQIEAANLLTYASNPYLRTLNKNYIYTQYLNRDIVPNLTLNMLVSHNMEDKGTQVTTVLNYYLGDNWRLAGNFVLNSGGYNTEYGRYLKSVHFVGLKYYFE